MPQLLTRVRIAFKAIHQLGLRQTGLFALYQLLLHTGWLAYKTRIDIANALRYPAPAFNISPLLSLADPHEVHKLLGKQGLVSLMTEADEISAGSVRLFGGEPVSMDFSQVNSSQNWVAYAKGHTSYPAQDIKLLWEPARFGWAFTLGRAYLLSRDERYAQAFWQHTSIFLDTHPPNNGIHWVSAQEVALRILAFTWASQVFAQSQHSTPDRLNRLGKAIAAHAARIPATLPYSRAQNNNHLLSEAVGMLTAGLTLSDHPRSSDWVALGLRWLSKGLMRQISPDGEYIQQSTNYHRLMLQLALWAYCITGAGSNALTSPVLERLAAATSWLLTIMDEQSGRVPNLGPNDGANILQLSNSHYSDYRPVLHAASLAFLGKTNFHSGDWDEMSMWLGLHQSQSLQTTLPQIESVSIPLILNNPSNSSWAYLRCARFNSRPGHADQLHLDLWWRGINIAQDAGTYLYNASPPWNNSLTHTAVHNTITVNEREQMYRAGKFLYLDWAQGQVTDYETDQTSALRSVTVQHNGYKKIGLIHQRTVKSCLDGSWQIDDLLKPNQGQREGCFFLRLHWLVPDWPWEVMELVDNGFRIDLESPFGYINLHLGIADRAKVVQINGLHIVRAGKVLCGHQVVSPTWGWVSPTYGVKLPALSLTYEVEASLPIVLTSHWLFPTEG